MEYLNFEAKVKNPVQGNTFDMVLYIDRGSVDNPSSTPIADYWNTTEPPSEPSMQIRRNKLRIAKFVLPSNATYPIVFKFKRKFRKPITFNQNTRLKLGHRQSDVGTPTIVTTWTAVFRK